MRKRKLEPGYEGKMEVRPATVRAPMQTGADDLAVEMQAVTKNIRHDVLTYEFHCKRIDEAQKIAGDKLAALINRAGIGGAQAIDYENPKVDGGGKGDTLTDAVADAHKRLRHVREALRDRYTLLVLAIGDGMSLKDIARLWEIRGPYRPNKRHMETYIAIEFRAGLDDLVGVFGIARGKTAQPIRVHVDEPTALAGHVPLHFGGATG